MRVDDTQLQRSIERIAQENKLSPDAFRKQLEREGVDFNRFREELRNEILIARLKEREVDSKILITDAEIDNYLKNQQSAGRQRTTNTALPTSWYWCRSRPARSRSRPSALSPRRHSLRLKGGADFRQVSAGVSDAQNALEGGPLGWRPSIASAADIRRLRQDA